MNALKIATFFISTLILGGCATVDRVDGPKGPELIASGRATQDGAYAEVGVKFSSVGDFVAFVSPGRWRSPVSTGGALSWMNPKAWQEDWDRTGRIFVGQAVMFGGAVAVALDYDDDDNDASNNETTYNNPPPPTEGPPGGGPGGTPGGGSSGGPP